MESLIAAVLGWVGTEDEAINLQTGLRVVNLTEDDDHSKCEVFYPDDSSREYEGKDADLILDRVELLTGAAPAMLEMLQRFIAQSQPIGEPQK